MGTGDRVIPPVKLMTDEEMAANDKIADYLKRESGAYALVFSRLPHWAQIALTQTWAEPARQESVSTVDIIFNGNLATQERYEMSPNGSVTIYSDGRVEVQHGR